MKKRTRQIPIVALRLRVKIRHRVRKLLASGDERRHCMGVLLFWGCISEGGTEGTILSTSEGEAADCTSLPDCGNILISIAPFSSARADQGPYRPGRR